MNRNGRHIPAQIRNLLFPAVLFGTVTLLGAAQKPLFMLFNRAACAGASVAELFAVVLHGLHLDLTVAGYVTALPVVLTALHAWVGGRWLRRVLGVYLTVIAVAMAVAVTLNLALYGYWGFPLDGSVLQFLATPREAAASVTTAEWILYPSLAAACFVAGRYFMMLTLGVPDDNGGRGCSATSKALFTLAAAVLAALDFLAVRGSVTPSVANVSKVYFSEKQVLNHAAVNPLFSFLSSAAGGDRLDEYEFFDEPTRERLFEPLRGDRPTSPDRGRLLTANRPDIVFILAESFGRSVAEAEVDGVPVAPEYLRLREESVFFDNLIGNSFRTDRGTAALLSGFPAQPKTSVMKMVARARNLPSVARTLREAGYATSYLYGGDLNFTNTAAYLYATGFEELVWQKDMAFDAPTSKWGYADDVTGGLFVDRLLAMDRESDGRPFFAVWQTLSSHEPFDVPVDRFESPLLNSVAFADECIGRAEERLRNSPLWDNLLIIIVADHGYHYPNDQPVEGVPWRRIPMLWLGGAVAGPRVVAEYASQTDLAATLLVELGLPHDDFLFSRDILDPQFPKFGYYCFNDGFGVVDADGASRRDNTSGRELSEPDDRNAARRLTDGKTMLQTTFKSIREL